ncbi:MAG TPA: ATP-binding cassette domain-containing protein [Longimicrobiales bacterium]|nr:ATP-binding cassette domain-containing protein [Longimicrobiales bacterium]
MTMDRSGGGDAAITLRGVRKQFGEIVAVRGMDLVVPRGATYGLLGPNGAGKTTTIRMVLNIFEPDGGEVRIFGEPVSQRVLDRIGYLPEERGMYRRMTVRRALQFFAELKGVPARASSPRIERWLERFGLADRIDARVQELSKGNQQKVQLIGTLVHEPEIVILDEPFSGLDPINQQVFKDVVLELKREGRTILFSTHQIEQAERACDHVCIIARGEKVVDGAVAEVKRTHGSENVAMTLETWSAGAVELVRTSSQVREVREDGVNLEAVLAGGGDAQALLVELVRAGVRLRRFERMEPSLEQIFVERVRPAAAETREVAHV